MDGAGLFFNNKKLTRIPEFRGSVSPLALVILSETEKKGKKRMQNLRISIKETSIIDLEVHQDLPLRSRLCFQ